jgi:guanylate kinase
MSDRRGFMFVLSSPSGAGKTTISRLLLQQYNDMKLSVSVTTREKRASEAEGVHYYFVRTPEFISMRDAGELLEWAEVHGNYYGTPRGPIENWLSQGTDVLFDIDWQGTLQLYEKARNDVVSVFILPPSIAELRQRLSRRAEDDATTIERRLENAREEIGHWKEYDYVLINDDLDRCFGEVTTILNYARAERAGRTDPNFLNARRLRRQENELWLTSFVQKLQRET